MTESPNRNSAVRRTGAWLAARPAWLFFFWAVWLAGDYFALGPWSCVRVHDSADYWLSSIVAVGGDWRSGRLGAWHPHMLCGLDRLANCFAWEPLAWPFAFLPVWLANGGLMLAQRLLAGYGTYRLLNDQGGCGRLSAGAAGLAYALFYQPSLNGETAGFTVVEGLAYPGLPWCIWLLARLPVGGRGLGAAALAGAGLALFSHLALALFALPVIWLWRLGGGARRRGEVWLLLAFTLGYGLAELPTGLALRAEAPASHRADWRPAAFSWENLRGKGLEPAGRLAEDNCLPLLIGLLGWLGVRRGAAEADPPGRRFLGRLLAGAILFLATIPLAYLAAVGLGDYFLLLRSFQWQRLAQDVPFLAVCAGAWGGQRLASGWRLGLIAPSGHEWRAGVGSLLLAAWIGLSVGQSVWAKGLNWSEWRQGANGVHLYRRPELQGLAQTCREPERVAAVGLHPALATAYGLEAADGYAACYSQRYQDYWARVIALRLAQDRGLAAKFSGWGNRAYLFAPPGALEAETPVVFRDWYSLPLLSLANVRYLYSPLELRDPELIPLASPQAEAQAAWREAGKLAKLKLLLTGRYPGWPLHVYENRLCLSRYRLVEQVRRFGQAGEVLAALAQASPAELAQTGFICAADVAEPNLSVGLDRLTQAPAGRSPAPVEVLAGPGYPDTIRLRCVAGERGAVLIAAQTFHPGWRASRDGAATALFPVDHAFQGVLVPPGAHEVELHYRPAYPFSLGQ